MDFSNTIPSSDDTELLQYFLSQDTSSATVDDLSSLFQDPPPSSSQSTPMQPMQATAIARSLSSTATATVTEQAQTEEQAQAQAQVQEQSSQTTIPIGHTILLPSTSFSYRQLSPNIPPPMPVALQKEILTLNSPITTTSSSESDVHSAVPRPEPMSQDIWVHRLLQLQQLHQRHHYQQHQLLQSTLLRGSTSSETSDLEHRQRRLRGSSSGRSVSPGSSSSSSPLEDRHKNAIYPSPPMQDDASMDSDDNNNDDDDGGHRRSSAGESLSDPKKPTAGELKKMTSKERRQLRNKLSARNFRVRRKEYITSLENQVKEARREAADLQRRLIQSELNCQFLRQELETIRLSQSLFTDGRMSKEHANLLASLLHPGSESFPTNNSNSSSNSGSSGTNGGASSAIVSSTSNIAGAFDSNDNSAVNFGLSTVPHLPQIHHQTAPLDSLPTNDGISDFNNMSSNTLAIPTAAQTMASSTFEMTPASLQPFVPFDGDWGLLINRAEVPEMNVDLKDESSTKQAQAAYKDLLIRYEVATKQEAELDEQMRRELRAHVEKKLAQTYMTMPKDESSPSIMNGKSSSDENLILQTLVYMMMIHLTQSLFEAATMSKTELVRLYQAIDEPLRAKLEEQGKQQQQQQQSTCKFSEWREQWIRKHWPSYYNNRRRLSELFKNGLVCSNHSSNNSTNNSQKGEVDVVETTRKMEEGVKGKTAEVPKVNYFVRHYVPTWLKCSDILEKERLLNEAKAQQRKARSTGSTIPMKATA
ncbi:hypothetical protein BX616_002213 [Lobosporangium transversale]|nr:hypothetical protein BX616_002213 [Lobosporangium transversale]